MLGFGDWITNYHLKRCPAKPSGDVVHHYLYNAFPSLTIRRVKLSRREEQRTNLTFYITLQLQKELYQHRHYIPKLRGFTQDASSIQSVHTAPPTPNLLLTLLIP